MWLIDADMILRCLDASTGRQEWQLKTGIPPEAKVTHAAHYRGKLWVMYSANGKVDSRTRDKGWTVVVFSAKEPKLLHEPEIPTAVASMTFSEGEVFMAPQHGTGQIYAIDTQTATIKRKLLRGRNGAKCTPLLATPNWLFYRHQAGSGFTRIDRKTWKFHIYDRIRSSCHYPGLPANGLLYVQGPGCNCAHPFRGNVALTVGVRRAVAPKATDDRLVKGPAYADSFTPAKGKVWASFRADATRSGQTDQGPALPLERAWSAQLTGDLTPLAAGGGLVFCGSSNRKLIALDVGTGKVRWQAIVGGRI
ncbi:hypothetical protein LCGC14_2487100, partial [marine sediment metagenome]